MDWGGWGQGNEYVQIHFTKFSQRINKVLFLKEFIKMKKTLYKRQVMSTTNQGGRQACKMLNYKEEITRYYFKYKRKE